MSLTQLRQTARTLAHAALYRRIGAIPSTYGPPMNLKEINAFALPGGPRFVHRRLFDAASSEAEVVGVMAHELSHVLLRHGTANATKAQNPLLPDDQPGDVEAFEETFRRMVSRSG